MPQLTSFPLSFQIVSEGPWDRQACQDPQDPQVNGRGLPGFSSCISTVLQPLCSTSLCPCPPLHPGCHHAPPPWYLGREAGSSSTRWMARGHQPLIEPQAVGENARHTELSLCQGTGVRGHQWGWHATLGWERKPPRLAAFLPTCPSIVGRTCGTRLFLLDFDGG